LHLQEPGPAKDTESSDASEPTDGAPMNGAPASGAPTDGVPADGAPMDGVPTDSMPTGGAPASGALTADAPAGGPVTPQRTSRTGRNLPVAIAVGLGLGGLAVTTLFTVKSTFLIMMGAAVVVALWELDRALRPREIRLPLVPLYAGQAALWTCAYWLGYKAALAALGLTLIALMGWRLHGPATGYLRDITASMFAVAYLPLPGMFVVLMLSDPGGARRTLLFLALTVGSDTGGYFAGILLGKHPLVPLISPKKTWEGLAGSALLCLVLGGVLLPALLHGHVWQGLLLGAAVVAVATMGDLIESMIKRDLGIKDMGSLLPGHGGALDRIDAMLVSAPVTWLLLIVFIPR
jgi:phosphatidate cytidylyltransferase